MYKFNDLTNKRYGKLVVIKQSGRTKDRHILWECKCDCGNIINVSSHDLTTNHTKSCGCLQKEVIKNLRFKHGDRDNRLYSVWKTMKKRCENPNCKSYKYYGARGIKVCDEWHDYSVFKEWAYNNGYDDKAKKYDCTIDRIDVNGDYEPSNCRWVSMKVQNNNKRRKEVTNHGRNRTINS